MPLHISTAIIAFLCIATGCKSKSESTEQARNQNVIVYTYEEQIDDPCEAMPLGSKMCQGKHQIRRWRIDTSEESLAALKTPLSIADPTNDFILGYKAGWKERSNNYYFYECVHHKDLSSAYTPMMRDVRSESDEYREGWELGWKRGAEDANLFLKQLKEKAQKK